jgi:hypothetical protein
MTFQPSARRLNRFFAGSFGALFANSVQLAAFCFHSFPGGKMLPRSKLKIQCPHCKNEFLQQAKLIRGGVTVACANCKELVRFDDASPVESIRKALSAAANCDAKRALRPFSSRPVDLIDYPHVVAADTRRPQLHHGIEMLNRVGILERLILSLPFRYFLFRNSGAATSDRVRLRRYQMVP